MEKQQYCLVIFIVHGETTVYTNGRYPLLHGDVPLDGVSFTSPANDRKYVTGHPLSLAQGPFVSPIFMTHHGNSAGQVLWSVPVHSFE